VDSRRFLGSPRLLRLWDKGIKMRCARGLLASTVAGLVMATAGGASAYPLLDASGGSISYDNGLGTSGTITYLGAVSGALLTGVVTSVGTIGATDTVLLFTATPAAGVIDSIGVGAVYCDPGPFTGGSPAVECALGNGGNPPYLVGRLSTGAGWGPNNADVDIASITGTAGTRIFNFADGPDGGTLGDLGPGETSDRFFVAYAAGDITFDLKTNLNFMISPESGSDFTTSVTLVPEPSTVLMFGLGLAGIAFAGRRRSQ
jgi:hypothetical protein